MRFSFAATVVLAVFSALLTVQGLVPAAAHPFGPPPVAEVTVDGDEVTVRWSAADDDLFALGRISGAMDGRQVFVYEDGVPVADQNGESSTPWMDTKAVADYLGSHIAIRHGGSSCALQGVDTDAIETRGAKLRYSCGSDVDVVQVRITALTDLDPTYRTMSTTPGGQRALHTSDEPTRMLDLGRSTEPTGGTTTLLAGGGAASLLVAGASIALLRRRRRPEPLEQG